MWFLPKWLNWRDKEPGSAATAPPASEKAQPPVAKRTSRRAGRPIASSLVRTLEAVEKNPDVTAAEVAELLGVTQSYARTLLRRARERVKRGAPVPVPIPTTVPAVSRRAAALKLSESGHSADFIADKLQTTTGEIEFILKVQRLLVN